MTGDQLRSHDLLHAHHVNIVQLSPDEWITLRDLKLRSLDQEPIAFADVEQERVKYQSRAEKEWRAILSGKMSGGKAGETVMFFARDDGHYVGMVSAIIPEGQTTATIQHMFVDNEGYRRKGVGKQLFVALLQNLKTRGNINKAELDVVVTQTPARGLYKSVGFKETGTVQIMRGGVTYDKVIMELSL